MRLLIVFAIALATCGAASAETARLITVTGQGRVEAAPDMATISMGVVTEGKTAAAAMAANSDRISAVLAQLKTAGIEERDIQTSRLNVHPRFDHSSSSNNQPPRIVGFVATNMLIVRMRDLDNMGAALDAALQDGANQFQGLSFGFLDPQPHQDDARRNAVADAKRKAELLAEAAGVELGDVITISESGAVSPRPMMMEAAQMSRGVSDVPVAPGEVTTQAQITIVYEIAGGE